MKNNSGHEFMLNTRYNNISPSPQYSGLVPQPPLELPLPAGEVLIPLPPPTDLTIPAMDLRVAIETRRSNRAYSPEPLSFIELSYLLWVSQGVRRVSTRPSTARNGPSARRRPRR